MISIVHQAISPSQHKFTSHTCRLLYIYLQRNSIFHPKTFDWSKKNTAILKIWTSHLTRQKKGWLEHEKMVPPTEPRHTLAVPKQVKDCWAPGKSSYLIAPIPLSLLSLSSTVSPCPSARNPIHPSTATRCCMPYQAAPHHPAQVPYKPPWLFPLSVVAPYRPLEAHNG
jgi:hypothetical protein